MLSKESIANLAVRDVPGQGMVVCIDLAAAQEGSLAETRQRVTACLAGLLLTIEWARTNAGLHGVVS
jgi:hypothetical protein